MGLKGFAEGGIASIVAGCSTHPLDLIKVRMQLQGEQSVKPIQTQHYSLRPALAYPNSSVISVSNVVDVHPLPIPTRPQVKVKSVGPLSVGMKILQTEGASALFSGVSATVLRLLGFWRLIVYQAH